MSETTEVQHPHICPVCMDSWLHESEECEPVYGDTRMTWARCPQHEGVEE